MPSLWGNSKTETTVLTFLVDEWREERAKRLSRAVEALSGGRIAGDHAERLAQAIIYHAEGYKTYAEGLIESLARGRRL